ncbi:MAG TPA: LCP family protein [Gaiellaceae bacterium]|jgi:LCP family protein required for cell wall assembly
MTAVTRYRAPRRGPLRLIGKILLWTLVVLLVAAGALAGGAWLFINQSVNAVQAHSREVIEAQEILAVPQAHQPTVAMVIGYDRRTHGVDAGGDSRSDTIMLIRADPNEKVISMLSFPRDLVVNIPGCRGASPFTGRINEAYTYCGPKGTLQTVRELTHIPINYIVTVNFRGFIKIVNKVGGVYLDVDHRYLNNNSSGGPTYAPIDLHSGYQHLNGKDALSFVRFRHTDSDIYRVVRQQEFVKSLKQQVSGFWSITKIPGIVNTITDNVEVGVGGGKSLNVETLYSYAKLAYGLPSGNFQQVQIQNLTGYNELAAPQSSIDDAVDTFLNPDVKAPEKAATAALGRRPKRDNGPPPSQVTIQVLNGNGIAGAADDAAYRLSRLGYQVVNGGNADNFKYFESKVFYDPASPDSEAAAKRLADIFGDAQAEAIPSGVQLTTTVRVIIGQTFHGTLTPGPRDTTPQHQPPAVTRDTTSAAPYVRAAKRKVDFQLMAPTVREQNSSLDSFEPSRTYRIDRKHDAFRLVYRTAGNEYWGIEEVGWEDPPILDGASLTQTIKGREYSLYFDGAKLHMIAFQDGGASYWVVNTLLNRLSNETMLAIAKGLKPAGRH